MSSGRRVLLVTPTTPLSHTLAHYVRRAGYDVTVVHTFQAARSRLATPPDLLITELKLGEYNGLQLALRMTSAGVPTIVVADKAYEHEVQAVGAVWMAPEQVAADELQGMMTRLVQGSGAAHPIYPWYDAGTPDSPSVTTLLADPLTIPRILH